MKQALAATLFALALTAGTAFAQDGMDTDHDGALSRAEFDAAQGARFDALDVNHDGALTGEEHPHWHGETGDSMSRADYVSRGAAVFENYDADHDAKLADAEFDAFLEHVAAYMQNEEEHGGH
jgi:hypothetical protein